MMNITFPLWYITGYFLCGVICDAYISYICRKSDDPKLRHTPAYERIWMTGCVLAFWPLLIILLIVSACRSIKKYLSGGFR